MSVEIMDASVYNEKNRILLNGTSVYEKKLKNVESMRDRNSMKQ